MIMRMTTLLAILLVMIPSTATAQKWTPEQEEVKAAVEATVRLFNEGDMNKSYELVHPDFVFWNGENAVPGDRETAFTLDSAVWGPVGTRSYGATVTPLTIKVFDDVAAVHAYIRGYRSVGDGEPEFSAVRWTTVWKKEDGKWLQILNYIQSDP